MTPLVQLGLLSALAVTVLDQASKHILKAVLSGSPGIEVIPGFFDLVVVWNRGVSFGMLGGDRPLPAWLLSGVAVAVCVGLFIWLRRTDRILTGWGIGLVMGGAIGNVIDRARWGAVFDFADFHVREWHWPAFNVADSAIVVGVGLMLVDSLIGNRRLTP